MKLEVLQNTDNVKVSLVGLGVTELDISAPKLFLETVTW